MVLPVLPTIDRLTLAKVTAVPDWHPQRESFEPFPVYAWVVRHPDGAILVDTGIGEGNELIDRWYAPEITPLDVALTASGVELDEITAVVLSHLHFDHCGQQRLLDVPVFVQAAEFRAAQSPAYTVEDWAAIPAFRRRLVDGDETIADGVQLVATPGHQSVVIEANDARVVFGAQCAFSAREMYRGEPDDHNVPDTSWRAAARASLDRLRRLGPATVHLSHDPEVIALP